MAPAAVVPVAKSLYLCDGHIALAHQKTDLIGLFNAINPVSYPHTQPYIVVFAQLLGGLGQVPFLIILRYGSDGTVVYSGAAKLLYFPHRNQLLQMAYTILNCRFPQAGTYLVELFYSGQWVADTTLELM